MILIFKFSGLNEIMHHFGTIAVAGNLLRANIDAQVKKFFNSFS